MIVEMGFLQQNRKPDKCESELLSTSKWRLRWIVSQATTTVFEKSLC